MSLCVRPVLGQGCSVHVFEGRGHGKLGFQLGGGASIELPQNWGGGWEKGSIDKTIT